MVGTSSATAQGALFAYVRFLNGLASALVELDHLFICVEVGAPEASRLANLGLNEGPPNTHPGQGTACRRFFLHNAYIELLWVEKPSEAQSDLVQPIKLWERWSNRRQGACPFGLCFRPNARGTAETPPFATQAYRPTYLPDGMQMDFGTNAEVLSEPELFWLSFAQRSDTRPPSQRPPLEHATGWRELRHVVLISPERTAPSSELQAVLATGTVELRAGDDHCLELGFDKESSEKHADLRPELPVVLRW